jgi:hypothetical protein
VGYGLAIVGCKKKKKKPRPKQGIRVFLSITASTIAVYNVLRTPLDASFERANTLEAEKLSYEEMLPKLWKPFGLLLE